MGGARVPPPREELTAAPPRAETRAEICLVPRPVLDLLEAWNIKNIFENIS